MGGQEEWEGRRAEVVQTPGRPIQDLPPPVQDLLQEIQSLPPPEAEDQEDSFPPPPSSTLELSSSPSLPTSSYLSLVSPTGFSAPRTDDTVARKAFTTRGPGGQRQRD